MKTLRFIILLIAAAVAAIPAAAAPVTASVENRTEDAEVSVKAVAGGIEVGNSSFEAVEVEVYSITGTVIRRFRADAGESVRTDLNSGIYIVRAGSTTARVLVR